MASAAAAGPKPVLEMKLGPVALPPVGYVAFCQRSPEECGEDPALVLEAARRAEAEREALLAPVAPAPAALGPQRPLLTQASHAVAEALRPAPEPLAAIVEAAPLPGPVAFVDPAGRAAEASLPAMTPELWARLNAVNARVNASIRSRTDLEAYGRDDHWATPIRDGTAAGDCEDFVLEKRRALIAAGVPRRALNIAVAVTPWGETHAVLLVATRKGEFVLDSLSPWVSPWEKVGYRWRQRQVNGDAFDWRMAAAEPKAGRKAQDGPLLIAALR